MKPEKQVDQRISPIRQATATVATLFSGSLAGRALGALAGRRAMALATKEVKNKSLQERKKAEKAKKPSTAQEKKQSKKTTITNEKNPTLEAKAPEKTQANKEVVTKTTVGASLTPSGKVDVVWSITSEFAKKMTTPGNKELGKKLANSPSKSKTIRVQNQTQKTRSRKLGM